LPVRDGAKPGGKADKTIQPDSDANPKTPATFVSHWKQESLLGLILAD